MKHWVQLSLGAGSELSKDHIHPPAGLWVETGVGDVASTSGKWIKLPSKAYIIWKSRNTAHSPLAQDNLHSLSEKACFPQAQATPSWENSGSSLVSRTPELNSHWQNKRTASVIWRSGEYTTPKCCCVSEITVETFFLLGNWHSLI